MIDPKWRRRMTQLANLVATWSKDPSTQVGAVIFDGQRRIVGLGYNGFPRGVRDLSERYDEKMVKYKLVVHAEANAILNSNKSVRECGLLATKFPCSECAKLIAQSGITDVFAPPPVTEGVWAEDAQFSRTILVEAGVEVSEIAVYYPGEVPSAQEG